VLIASQPGNYTVELDILVPYQSSRKTGFVLSVPKSATNQVLTLVSIANELQLTFKVKSADVLIKVDPCLFSQQREVKEEENSFQVKKSVLSCRFPPTQQLSVQWYRLIVLP
jgi:hypothetical protein